MSKKNAQKCPKGNTETFGQNLRMRWFPSFTSYLETEPHYDKEKIKYLCYGKEICPTTNKEHWQGCVYFFDKVSLKQAQKILEIGNSHMESIMLTDMDTCAGYCKKDGLSKEYGNLPAQGRRNDLQEICEDITSGQTSVDEILLSNPIMYHQYGRTFEKTEDLRMRKIFRTEMTKGIWYYGQTGVGKSHKAFENYNPETHYVLPDDNGWWDAYKQQPTVIINDFRGHIKYDMLLQLIDKWPVNVPRRGREPLPFTSGLIIITSALTPETVYNNRNSKDSIEQLNRRIEIIEL